MRSRSAGHLVVFYQRTDMLNVPPSYVPLNDTKLLKQFSGHKYDIWFVLVKWLVELLSLICR